MNAKRNYAPLVLLLFPIFGVIAMVIIIAGNRNTGTPQQIDSLPTPAPIRTTPVPTVTPRVILDNIAPDFTLTTLDGKAFKLADLQGKTVFVNFWATWCPPCVREAPTLEKFAEDHPEVVVLGVTDPADGQTMDDIHAFIEEYDLKTMSFGMDQNGMLQINFLAINLPMTFVLDKDGIVRFRQIGEVSREDLEYYLAQLS